MPPSAVFTATALAAIVGCLAMALIGKLPLTYSIANGILLGMIADVLMNLICGNFKKVSPLICILAVLFVLK